MKLYRELAHWWPLFSPAEDYAEEAAFYQRELIAACDPPCRTLLELGSGGGNNASHMKARFEITLVDLSAQMLATSRALNPECEHHQGDMREGLFGRDEWLQMLTDGGFEARCVPFDHSELAPGTYEIFVCRRAPTRKSASP